MTSATTTGATAEVPAATTTVRELGREALTAGVRRWLDRTAAGAADRDAPAVAQGFEPDGYWRDIIALGGSLHTYYGRDQIEQAMAVLLPDAGWTGLDLDPGGGEFPRVVSDRGRDVVQAALRFHTRLGTGRGVVTLVPTAADWRAATLLTALDELRGCPERRGAHRPTGHRFSRTFHGPNWRDLREAEARYDDREPDVVVVGAGQAGLSVAARLKHLGVDTLVVERNARVGDNWRHRYHSLTLHNEVWANHLPYLSFPDSWPIYIPKDKLADWLESYVGNLELNCWTGTELLAGDHDGQRWSLRIRRDGRERVLRPRHLVLATGVSCAPRRPVLPGQDEFAGPILHTSEFTDGEAFRGQRVLVVGSGTSGHDVAHELHEHGARVVLAQRGATTVVTVGPEYAGQFYTPYNQGRDIEDTDLLTASVPFPVLRRRHQELTRDFAELDRDLLAGLRAVGFDLDFGEDGTGYMMKYLQQGGGYYMNVGCSDLLADRKIELMRWAGFERLAPTGALLRDGRTVPLDAVILATGYSTPETMVAAVLGDEVAGRIGRIWGFDDEGELRNMWRPTGQPGLWFTAGSLAQARIYSKYLALQIKALDEGLIEPRRRDAVPCGRVRPVDLHPSLVEAPDRARHGAPDDAPDTAG